MVASSLASLLLPSQKLEGTCRNPSQVRSFLCPIPLRVKASILCVAHMTSLTLSPFTFLYVRFSPDTLGVRNALTPGSLNKLFPR